MNRWRRASLKFDIRWIDAILNGDKNATVRYDDGSYDDHNPYALHEGDLVSLVDEEGVEFALGRVQEAITCKVSRVLEVMDMVDAEYPTETDDELLMNMNRYYTETISGATEVRVIVFDLEEE